MGHSSAGGNLWRENGGRGERGRVSGGEGGRLRLPGRGQTAAGAGPVQDPRDDGPGHRGGRGGPPRRRLPGPGDLRDGDGHPHLGKKYHFVPLRSPRPDPDRGAIAPTAALATLDSGEGLFRIKQMNKATLDILDRFGFWRMTDLTIAAGFSGRTLER